MPVITLADGSERRFDSPVSVMDVAESIGPGLARATLGGAVDGRLVDAAHCIDHDARLRIITDRDEEGLEILRHSCAHLMAQAVKSLYPGVQVTIGPVIEDGFYYDFAYERAFTPEDLEAIQKKTRNEFQEKYRNNVDVLLVDDIHFLAGKDATQEEFFHTFNSLYNGRKQIVISSDCPPKDLALITDRLRSRFAGGLIAEIQPPDVETREAILWQKCEQEKIKLPVEVIRLISQRVQSSIRELEGALVKLAAHARYTGKRITLEMAQEILHDVVQEDPRGISIEKIQKHVAEHFRVKTSDILGSKRNRSIAVPRRVAMFLSRELTNHSFPEIGVFFGNKDHSTVIHACKKVEEEMRESEDFAKFMERLKQEVRGMGS